MANGIDNYTRRNKRKDLTDVGQKIKALSGASDSTIVNAIVGFGLQIAQNAYLDAKAESRSDFIAATKSVSTALNSLDYTQSGTELTDSTGITYDPYDRQYKVVEEALLNLKDFQDDPALKGKQAQVSQILNEFTEVLAHKDAMKNQREGYLDNMENLYDKYMNLVKTDPSMTDPGVWSNSTEIMDDMELAYANVLVNSGKKIPAEKTIQYKNAVKMQDMILRGKEGDVNKDLEGFQANLSDKGSPYLQSFFTMMGMEKVDADRLLRGPEGEMMTTPEGQATYLPELADTVMATGEGGLPAGGMMVDGEWIGSAQQQFEVPDTEMYKEVLKAFDKFQLIDIAREADKLVKKEAASGMQDFEVVRDWMEAGTAEQSMYGLYVGHELFADPHEPNPYESQLDKEILDRIPLPRLKDKKASGMYATQFEAMQTDFINMQKANQTAIDARQKLYGKTMDDLDDVTGKKIRVMSSNLNKEITKYNKASKSDIIDVPAFADAFATTHEAKSLHVDVLQNIISADDAEEFRGNNAWNEESLLKDFKDASGIAKWYAMRKLVEKYFDENGQPTNEVLARDVWDAEGLRSEEGQERYDLFYATLRSFRELMLADPYGTIFTPETIGD